MKMDDKIKIVDALVEIKITLNRYLELIPEYTPKTKPRLLQIKKAFESIDDITEILKSN